MPWHGAQRVYQVARAVLFPPSLGEIHAFWSRPNLGNQPADYLDEQWLPVSDFLVSVVQKYVPTGASIMELGPNAGRNLNALFRGGYKHLSGIELNPEAVALMRQRYPDLPAKIYQGPVEDLIRSVPLVDCIFSVSVLMHVHPKSDWIFADIAQKASTIITIEDEYGRSWRVFPRRYRRIFEGLGFEQVEEIPCSHVPGMDPMHRTRVFRKIAAAASGS